MQIVIFLAIYFVTGLLSNDRSREGTISIDYTAFTAQLDAGKVEIV